MLDAEEISGLKLTHLSLKNKLAGFGEKQQSELMLSLRLKGLIAEIDSTIEKEKTLMNPALITRVKLAKKGIKVSKGIYHFEREVAAEFEKGNISENAGRRLISILRLIKEGDINTAKKEFGYFEDYIDLNKRYETADEALKEKGRVLRREEHRVEKTLEEMADLEKQVIDQEKVKRHEDLSKDIGQLENAREAYIGSLLTKPVAELLDAIETHPFKDRFPLVPGNEDLAALKGYFLQCPGIGSCNIEELCGLFDLSEKRLSHACTDTSGFKKIVGGNRNLFETIRSLRQSRFLTVDIDDEALLDYYASNGLKDTVGRIRMLKANRHSAEEEFEKSREIERKKAELSRYSKKGLEDELANIRRLIALLESERVEEKGKGNLLAMLGSLLDKLSLK